MGCLPDELWSKIMGMGVENQVLDYRDMCSLAFVCRRIRRISSLDCMWRPLWERDQAQLGGGSATVGKDGEIKNFREFYRIRLVFSLCSDGLLVRWFCVGSVEVIPLVGLSHLSLDLVFSISSSIVMCTRHFVGSWVSFVVGEG